MPRGAQSSLSHLVLWLTSGPPMLLRQTLPSYYKAQYFFFFSDRKDPVKSLNILQHNEHWLKTQIALWQTIWPLLLTKKWKRYYVCGQWAGPGSGNRPEPNLAKINVQSWATFDALGITVCWFYSFWKLNEYWEVLFRLQSFTQYCLTKPFFLCYRAEAYAEKSECIILLYFCLCLKQILLCDQFILTKRFGIGPVVHLSCQRQILFWGNHSCVSEEINGNNYYRIRLFVGW